MAGVGEASAILAIAQFGVKFALTIWEFAGEVQGARKEIGRLVRNIRTTSERLQDIGRLLKENPVSHLFNEGGIESAVRCSNDCEDIISDVSKVLVKAGREPTSRTLEQKDLDISKLDALFWPFVRKKLVGPQADLERVKADLMLLLHSAMALKESNPLQSKYALEIPRLKQWAEQATRRSETIKHRTESSGSRAKISTQREAHRRDSEDQVDPEMRQRFLAFQARLAEEAEDRRVQERAAYLHAEEVKRQEAEDANRKIVEQNAISAYKQEQEDRDARALEREKQLKDALTELGLEQEKIQSIIKTPCLQMPENGNANTSVSKVRLPPSVQGDHEDSSSEASPIPSKPYSNSSWLYRIFSNSGKLQKPVINKFSGDDKRSKFGNRLGSVYRMELWLIDVLSGQVTELETSQKWLESHMKQIKHHDTLRRLAQMRHQWQMAVQHCLRLRNEKEVSGRLWKLFSIGFPRKVSRVPLFGHYHGDCLLQLAICQRDDSHVSDHSDSWELPPLSPVLHVPPALGYRNEPPVVTGNQNATTAEKPANNVGTNHVSETGKGHIQKAGKRSNLQVEKPGKLVDGIRTVIIEDDRDYRDDSSPSGFTLIPKDLIYASALKELEYAFTHVPDSMANDSRQFLRVPLALDDDEITQLVTVSMEQVEDKQALSATLPEVFKIWRLNKKVLEDSNSGSDSSDASSVDDEDFVQHVVETDFRIHEHTPGYITIEKRQTRITIEEDHLDSYTSNKPAHAPDAKDIAKHERLRGSPSPSQWAHRGDRIGTTHGPSEPWRPTVIRDEHGDRDKPRDKTYKIYDSAGEAGADQDHYRKRSFERIRPFQQDVPREDTNRMRPTVYGDESRAGDVLKARSNRNTSNLRPHASLLPWIQDDHTTNRHEEGLQLTVRPDQFKSEKIRKAAGPRDDTLFHPETLSSRRPRYQGSLHDSDNSEPSERGAGRLVRFESRSNVRRPMRRLTGCKTPERTLSRHKDPGHDAQRRHQEATNSSKGRNISEAKEDEEDVISRTLKRYTTFNSDNDPDLVASPDEADSSGLSDNDTFDVTTLEQAQQALRRLVEKQEKASKNGDLMTESDLRFYAIPDVEARIQQLNRQQDQGLEDREDRVEEDGRLESFLTKPPETSGVPKYDLDPEMEEFHVPDAPPGRANPRHGDESLHLDLDYDREETIDPRSARKIRIGDGSGPGSEDSPSEYFT